MQIGVITNPNSRKNKGKPDRAQRLQSIVGELGEVHETRTLESIKPVLREFLRKRARYWVADGGDGALHWMLRMGMEVLQEDEFAGQRVAMPLTMPTNGGTIDFIAGNVGIKGDAEGLLATLRGKLERGPARRGDRGRLDAHRGRRGHRRWRSPVPHLGLRGRRRRHRPALLLEVLRGRRPQPAHDRQGRGPHAVVDAGGDDAAAAGCRPGAARRLRPAMFKPTRAKVTLDGMVLPGDEFTGIHVASMSINLGNVLKFFGKADQPGLMNAIVGTPSPWAIARNLPRMARGDEMVGREVLDRPCRELVMEAVGDELLEPVIDGEYYRNLRRVSVPARPACPHPQGGE
jgi:diacylglycerol kinase family enzyme